MPLCVALAQNQIQLFTHQGSCQSCNCWAALGFSGQIFASFVASEKHIIPQLLNPPSLFVCPFDIAILVQY